MRVKRFSKKAVSGMLCLVMLLTGICGMSVSAAATTYTLDMADSAYADSYPDRLILRQNGTEVTGGTILYGGDVIDISHIYIVNGEEDVNDTNKVKNKIYWLIDGAKTLACTATGTAGSDNNSSSITLPENDTGYYYQLAGFVNMSGGGITICLSTIPALPADHTHTYHWQSLGEASETEDGKEIYVCDCGDISERRVTTAMGMFWENAIRKLQDAKAGDTVSIESTIWNSYPQRLLEAIAARRDITIQITFPYQGKDWKVLIPADAAIDTSCEWYGPEKMTQMFGREEIVK